MAGAVEREVKRRLLAAGWSPPSINATVRLGDDERIEKLNLTIRAFNALSKRGINTVGQLTEMTELDLYKIRDCGKVTVQDIEVRLAWNGRELAAPKPSFYLSRLLREI